MRRKKSVQVTVSSICLMLPSPDLYTEHIHPGNSLNCKRIDGSVVTMTSLEHPLASHILGVLWSSSRH